MEPSNSFVIEAKGLRKAYQGLKALEGVSLQVPGNSIYGFSDQTARAQARRRCC